MRRAAGPARAPARGQAPRPRHARRATSLAEALAGLLARPARVALTVLGTVIGVGALVATLGLSKTAGNQIVGRFDALVGDRHRRQPLGARAAAPAPRSCRGTPRRACGGSTAWPRPARSPTSTCAARSCARSRSTTRSPRARSSCRSRRRRPACSARCSAELAAGRFFDAGHSRARRPRRSCSGPNAARRLGITRRRPAAGGLHRRPPLRRDRAAGGRRAARRRCSARRSCPRAPPAASSASRRPALAQVETRVGAVDLIARQAPARAQPRRPGAAARSRRRPTRGSCAARCKNDLNALFLLLGGVSLLVGAHRDRQRHARLGARARGRDRPAPRARRGAPPHRRAVPAREHRDGAGRRHHRRQPRHARHRRRLGEQDLDAGPRPLGPARRARCSAR